MDEKEKNVPLTISLPKSQKEAWQREAEAKGQNMSVFVRRAVSAYLFALNSRKKKVINAKLNHKNDLK